MALRTWEDTELPLLEAIVTAEQEGRPLPGSEELSSALGIDHAETTGAMYALGKAGYLEVRRHGGGNITTTSINERARRGVGQWPSDDLYGDLLALLEARIEGAEGDKRSRLVRLRDGFAGAGRDVVVEVVAAVLTGRAGI